MKIAHISDLHFGASAGGNAIDQARRFQYLVDSLKEASPDALIVSGDIVDTPEETLFSRSKEEILRLCRECKLDARTRMFVVPGNHDVWQLGVGGGDRTLFDKYFGEFFRPPGAAAHDVLEVDGVRLAVIGLDSNPPRDRSYGLGLVVATIVLLLGMPLAGAEFGAGTSLLLLLLFALVCVLSVRVFKKWKHALMQAGERAIGSLRLARGRLLPTEFDRLRERARVVRDEDPTRPITVVAVIHHHPMPNPDAIGAGGTEVVGLALENAGETLGELQKARVDAVLHGHRHTPFLAIAPRFLAPSSTYADPIPIVACGTSSHPSDRPTGVNQWNLITLDVDGTLRVESYEARDREFSFRYRETVRVCEEFRERAIRQLEKRSSIFVGKYKRIVKVLAHGDARIQYKIEVPRSDPRPTVEIPIGGRKRAISSADGGIMRYDPRMESCLASNKTRLRIAFARNSESDENCLSGHLVIGGITEADFPLHATYGAYVQNAYARTHEDFDRMYLTHRRDEFTDTSVSYPVEEITVLVKMGAEMEFASPEVHAACPDGRSVQVYGELARTRSGFRISKSGRIVCWKILRPCPYWNYRVYWRPKDLKPDVTSTPELPRLYARQESLTDWFASVGESGSTGGGGVQQSISKILNAVRSQLQEGLGSEEDLELVLFGFSRKDRRIVPLACAPERSSIYEGFALKPMRWGQGVAGKAFRLGIGAYWKRLAETNEAQDTYLKLGNAAKPEVCFALGRWFPDFKHSAKGVVAVLSIVSKNASTNLYRVYESMKTLGVGTGPENARVLQEVNKAEVTFWKELLDNLGELRKLMTWS